MEYSGGLSIKTITANDSWLMYLLQVRSLTFMTNTTHEHIVLANPTNGVSFEYNGEDPKIPGFTLYGNGVAIKIPDSEVDKFKKLRADSLNNNKRGDLPVDKVEIKRYGSGSVYHAYVKD